MAMRTFDLNLLPALNALLEQRNVTRAAEQVSIGQPAMSAALARLRRHFDDPLLVREGRVYHLSAFAESLLESVREAMVVLDAATASRRDFTPATDGRTFTIAASDYVALVFLRPLLNELALQAPGVRLRIVPIMADLGDALRRGALDLVLLPAELAGALDGLPRQALFEDRFVLAADRDNAALAAWAEHGHGSRAVAPIDLDLLATLPFVAVTGPMTSLLALRLRELGVELRIDVSTEAFVIAPMLVQGTPLVCLVQERLGRLVEEHAQLRLHQAPAALGGLVETMFWGPRRTDDPAHRWLRAQLTAQAETV